jgi:uncharacterized protein (TIGR02265 family)
MTEPTIQGGIFEGLFERKLQPTGAFAEQLREAGYDLKRPEPQYPFSVFVRCLEIARQNLYPGKSREEGDFLLGEQLSEGYFDGTIAGKVASVALHLVGPDRVMKGLPSRIRMGVDSPPPACEQVGERHWRVTFAERDALPDLAAGSICVTLRRTGVEPKITVVRSGPHPVLDVTWTAKKK